MASSKAALESTAVFLAVRERASARLKDGHRSFRVLRGLGYLRSRGALQRSDQRNSPCSRSMRARLSENRYRLLTKTPTCVPSSYSALGPDTWRRALQPL